MICILFMTMVNIKATNSMFFALGFCFVLMLLQLRLVIGKHI